MSFQRKDRISIFRKVALSLWNSGGDPSVYGFLEVDITGKNLTVSPMNYVIKSMAQVMKKHRELNSIIRWGRLYTRNNINISVMVNMQEGGHHDLSFLTLENVDALSLQDIEQKISKKAILIRKKEDPHLGFALRLIQALPWFMTSLFLNIYSFVTHDLNINLSAINLPHIPLGSVIITNVGSLGIKNALVPLVPFSRASVLVSLGKVSKEARVVNDKIEIREILHLGVTFDHRYFDGSHAAQMIREFEASMAEIMQ